MGVDLLWIVSEWHEDRAKMMVAMEVSDNYAIWMRART